LNKKIYLITPVSRKKNLIKIKKTIKFNYFFKWIIIYDTKIIKDKTKIFSDNKNIIELFHKQKFSVSGNAQRNLALKYLNKIKNKDFYIYFLDDDNVIHKNFYIILDKIKSNSRKKIYTFDQYRNDKIYLNNKFEYLKILKGNKIIKGNIDIAMFLPHFSLVNNIRWKIDKYESDGRYIVDCFNKKTKYHEYIPIIGCYYNFFNQSFFRSIKEDIKKLLKNLTKNL
jgi:hypothetical protein